MHDPVFSFRVLCFLTLASALGAADRPPNIVLIMTAYMDKLVGRLMAKLEALGLRENTLILFLGDNGTGVGVTSQFKGQPYPGGKGTASALGTHTPLIASWPARIAAGKVNADLVSSVDFLPTICAAAGATVPAALKIDGRSFLPQLLGQKGQPREWLYSWYARNGGGKSQWEYAMTASHKLYRDGRFFDLTADPFEENKPLAVAALTGRSVAAAKTLQGALDQYAHARPAHLMTTAPAADDDDAGGAKKKTGKGKKKQ